MTEEEQKETRPILPPNRTFSYDAKEELYLSPQFSESAHPPPVKDYFEPTSDMDRKAEIGARPSLMKGTSQKSQQASVHFTEDLSRLDSYEDYQDNYSTHSLTPFAEGSRDAQKWGIRDVGEQGVKYDSFAEEEESSRPSDFEVFLAQSRAQYESERERNWPTVEIDSESFVNKDGSKKGDKKVGYKRFAIVRKILRGVQAVISVIVVALLGTTLSGVRETDSLTNGNDTKLWPSPLIDWPELLVIIVASISFGTSILLVLATLVEERLSETKGRLGLMVGFGLNATLLVAWLLSTILFRTNSSANYIWGYACSNEGMDNSFVSYSAICERETISWVLSIVATAIEVFIIIFYLLTALDYSAVKSSEEEALRISEMRMSVHRTMTGRAARRADYNRRKPSKKALRKGWEVGGKLATPKINIVEDTSLQDQPV